MGWSPKISIAFNEEPSSAWWLYWFQMKDVSFCLEKLFASKIKTVKLFIRDQYSHLVVKALHWHRWRKDIYFKGWLRVSKSLHIRFTINYSSFPRCDKERVPWHSWWRCAAHQRIHVKNEFEYLITQTVIWTRWICTLPLSFIWLKSSLGDMCISYLEFMANSQMLRRRNR